MIIIIEDEEREREKKICVYAWYFVGGEEREREKGRRHT